MSERSRTDEFIKTWLKEHMENYRDETSGKLNKDALFEDLHKAKQGFTQKSHTTTTPLQYKNNIDPKINQEAMIQNLIGAFEMFGHIYQ